MPTRIIFWKDRVQCHAYHKDMLRFRDGFYDLDSIVDRAMEYGSNMAFNTDEEADDFEREYSKWG